MSVYFITAREVGRVKIGCAYDPAQRMERMQTGSPVVLAVEAVIHGAYEQERAIQALFVDERLHGEWFTITEEIEAVIAANRAPPTLTKDEKERLQPPRPPRTAYEHDDVKKYHAAMAEMYAERERAVA